MNTISMTSYKSPQKLNPLSLLAQLSSRHANGCLQVSSGSVSWSIYLEQGKLIYACDSADPFERLDLHLRRLSRQIPTLVSAVRVQVRLIFESDLETQSSSSPDYQAICWLVNQKYLNSAQAATLIEELAEEVIGSLLSVKEGSHRLINLDQSEELPKFCHLDLRTLVERCYEQLRRQQSSPSALTSSSGEAAGVQRSINRQEYLAPNSNQSPLELTAQKTNKPSQFSLENQQPNYGNNDQNDLSKNTYSIACIDDSPTVLNAINSFLDDKSFSVVMINDPVRALMQVVRIKPDLILLDVEMPNLDGYELCSLLRKHPLFKTTPIIMVTGHTGFLDRAKAKLVRASGYLTKPFNQSELLKMVFKHLS
ncbi:MAG: response regulator [Symploca sp. SIO3C6]|uniref:Response regulator n=1 Tax=Symploca sp. SIO1C4 TaxID=2607765 RepID=A0A6B3NDW8_9CYAN|nr:response regulator [Symploca sp. SIO3C6]NER29790.1 response regulator [Symploca sp. SIO1C4]NET09265.1 response regulator [Symploca sp. SIO2B6]NET47742.1 response regulator [Merismopedia sp. SIO2A8]